MFSLNCIFIFCSQRDASFVSRDVEIFVHLLVSQSEFPKTMVRWLQNGASDEEKRSLTVVLSCISKLLLEQSELLSRRASFREITFLENSVPNFLRYLVSESTAEERKVIQRLFHDLVKWRFDKFFFDGKKTDLLSDWLLSSDDFESVQHFVQILFKLKHWYKRDELFRQIKKVPIFKDVSIEAIKALVSNVTLKTTKSGEVIIYEGADGDEMYFVVDGTAIVLDKDEQNFDLQSCKAIAELGPGTYFGEIALLAHDHEDWQKRTRSVVSKTDCELYVLKYDQFEVCMDMYPELRWSINQEADRRKSASETIHSDVNRRHSVLQLQENAKQNLGREFVDPRKLEQVDTVGSQNLETGEQAETVLARRTVAGGKHTFRSIFSVHNPGGITESEQNNVLAAKTSVPGHAGLLMDTLIRKRPHLQVYFTFFYHLVLTIESMQLLNS